MQTTTVFGYGSLMYEPELPEALIERRPARLEGVHRWFCKRSRSRGCPARFAPARAPVPGFVDDAGDRWSLALGTQEGGHMDGLALVYPASVQATLLKRLHQREGPGYLGRAVTVFVDGAPLEAAAWLSDPHHESVVDLPMADQATVLLAATPTEDVDGRARGARYLLDLLELLADMGVWDPRMEALGELVRRGIAHTQPSGYS